MAANFSLIAHAAERDTNEFAAGGVADGHGERGLAHARRSDEAKDGAFGIFYELAYGKEFEDALFDFIEAVMLVVENFFGGFDVTDFFGTLLPGYGEQPIEIVAAHGGFGGHRGHRLETLGFLNGFELFVEVVLFLRALHLALDAGVDVAVDVELFQLDFEDVANAVEALKRIDGFEQVLLFVDRKLQVGGDGVGKAGGIIDTRSGDHGVVI